MNSQTKNTKKSPLKILRNVLITLVVLIVALLAFVQFGLGFTVRKGAAVAGPAVIGTSIDIGHAKVRPLSGIVNLSELVVGPPEGFKANVFEMNQFLVVFDPASLLTDTIVIKEIKILNPVVSYELSGIHHNIGAIMDRLESLQGQATTDAKPDSKAETRAKPAKKVIIEHFLFSGAKIRIASTTLGGKGAVLPMPVIELHDIGKKSGGATSVEVITEIFGSIAKGILGTLADGALAIGGVAVDGAKAVGGAAVDGVKAVGGTAVKGVKALGGAIGGLLGGGDDKNETAN